MDWDYAIVDPLQKVCHEPQKYIKNYLNAVASYNHVDIQIVEINGIIIKYEKQINIPRFYVKTLTGKKNHRERRKLHYESNNSFKVQRNKE